MRRGGIQITKYHYVLYFNRETSQYFPKNELSISL